MYISNSGYIMISINNKQIQEHRYVWEQVNGIIPKGYIIHHIDENKLNNSIDNLQCMTNGEHSYLHSIRSLRPSEEQIILSKENRKKYRREWMRKYRLNKKLSPFSR